MRPTSEISRHVRRAAGGDDDSVAWIVGRLSPLLVAQARYRMGGVLLRELAPEDVVREVWAIALPRLDALAVDDARTTPALLKFLGTILLHRVNAMIHERILRATGGDAPSRPRRATDDGDLVTSVVRSDGVRQALAAIDRLDGAGREAIVLHDLEQRPAAEVARLLGTTEAEVHERHRRALEALRRELPGSVFDELAADERRAG